MDSDTFDPLSEPEETAALQAKFDRELRAFWHSYGRSADTWSLALGSVRLSRRFGSMRVFYALLAMLAVSLVSGVSLTLFPWNESATALGVSLVVGSIFAATSMTTEIWSLQLERERQLYGGVFSVDVDDLRARKEELDRLWEELGRSGSS